MANQFETRSREKAAKIGKTILEGAKNHPRASVRDKWSGVVEASEDMKASEAFDDDSALYTALQADMIEQALEPDLLGLDAINTIQFELNNGVDSIQVPSGNQLTASKLDADGSLSEDTSDYDSQSIDIDWVGVRTTFSGQLVQKSKVDLLAFRMEQAGRAIARKVDEDILEEIEKAGTKDDSDYDDNDNYNYLESGNDVTFTDVIESIANAAENDARVDLLVTNPKSWANFMTESDTLDAINFGNERGDVPMVQMLGPIRIFMTSQVSEDKLLLVDTDRCGVYVDASSVETFDGRVNEAYQFEILAVKAYGVGIVQPQTVYVIHEDTDEPA